jgi:heme-degrading monooxygenase HmoA
MIAVMFEVKPAEGQSDRYFELAGGLKGELQKIDGFISVERFQSLVDDGKYLSLSFWRDEEAVENWFCHSGHNDAQTEGRAGIFKDYRIRVASVFRDYDLASGRPAT